MAGSHSTRGTSSTPIDRLRDGLGWTRSFYGGALVEAMRCCTNNDLDIDEAVESAYEMGQPAFEWCINDDDI